MTNLATHMQQVFVRDLQSSQIIEFCLLASSFGPRGKQVGPRSGSNKMSDLGWIKTV